jgi:integrase
MSVKKQGKTWYVFFRPFGAIIKLSLKDCENKRQALVIEAELIEALRKSDYSQLSTNSRQACVRLFVNQKWEMPETLKPAQARRPPKVITFWNGVKIYVNDPSFKNLSMPKRYHQKLAHLVKYFGKNRPVKDITIPVLKAYRENRSQQGVTNATINREMSAISGVFRVLIEHQLLEINPCRQIKKLSEKSGERQVYISLADVERIRGFCPAWFQDMMWISYLSGMRKGEVFKLRWSNVNLPKRIISFHATDTKEGKSKRVPIHRELTPVFERIGKVRSLSDDKLFQVDQQSLQKPWQRALNQLNWEKPTPRFHDLRHTWKTNARRSGIDSEIRELILGHAGRTLNVSERYGFVSDEELLSAIDKFTYDNGLTQILVASSARK